MDKIFIGKIVGTFGLKGDLKVVSNFEAPEKVFVIGNNIYLNDEKHVITDSKLIKNNYVIKIDNINDINLVENFRKKNVFISKEDLGLKKDEYLLEELINYKVYEKDYFIGSVTAVSTNKQNPLLEINNQFYIPVNANFIKNVNKEKKIIEGENLKSFLLK